MNPFEKIPIDQQNSIDVFISRHNPKKKEKICGRIGRATRMCFMAIRDPYIRFSREKCTMDCRNYIKVDVSDNEMPAPIKMSQLKDKSKKFRIKKIGWIDG